jgi:hypothetical protein
MFGRLNYRDSTIGTGYGLQKSDLDGGSEYSRFEIRN